jgi:hypothetical protein
MPIRSSRRRCSPTLRVIAASAAAALAGRAVPAAALEHTRLEPVWIETTAPDGEGRHLAAALLNLPPGWMVGDAVAVVLSDGPWSLLARGTLVAALLEERAAVLELDPVATRDSGPEPTAAERALDLRGAVAVLRREIGVGLVVALGNGVGGDAVMLAATLDRPATHSDGAGMLAAAASLGPGPARFARGGAEPGRGWSIRAERLCSVLAAAVAAPAEPRAEEAECRRALVTSGDAHAWAAHGR